MAQPISSLFVELAANTARLQQDMGKASRIIERNARKWDSRVERFAAGFAKVAAGLGVAGIVSQFKSLTEQAIAAGAEIEQTSRKIGLPPDVLQSWSDVSRIISGLDAGAAATALQRFSRRIGEAAMGEGVLVNVFKEHNIQVRDAEGRIKSLDALMREYAGVVRNASSQQEALALTVKAVDTEAAGMVNTFQLAGDEFDAVAASSASLSNSMVEASGIMSRHWDLTWNNIVTSTQEALIKVAASIAEFFGLYTDLGSLQAKILETQDKILLAEIRADEQIGRNRKATMLSIARMNEELADLLEQEKEILRFRNAAEISFGAPTGPSAPPGSTSATKNAAAATESMTGPASELNAILEEADELWVSTRTGAENYAASLERLKALYQAGVVDADLFNRGVVQIAETYEKTQRELDKNARDMDQYWKQAGDSIGDTISGMIQGVRSASDAVKALIADLASLAAKYAINKFILPALGLTAAATGMAMPGGSTLTPGVYHQPTLFKFADGGNLGLMAEAGAEAVLPLTRTSSGKLGVEATGGAVNVSISNYAAADGYQASTRPGLNPGDIEVVIARIGDQINRGGNHLSRSFERAYSLSRGR